MSWLFVARSSSERFIRWQRDPRAQYLIALLAVVLATLVRLPFEPLLRGRAPYGLYFPVLVVIAWTSGVGPTVVAGLLSLICAWFVFLPLDEPGYKASVAVYGVTAIALTWLAKKAAAMRVMNDDALIAARRLAAIVESSDDAIIGKDLDGVIHSWNAGAQRIYGYSAEEIVGRPITLLVPPDRLEEERGVLAALRRGERVDHLESIRVAKDGRLIEMALTSSPIRDTGGAIVGASSIGRDISEARRAERNLAQQREWFRVTLASIGDAVITSDRSGAVTYMNSVAERLTGWTLVDAEGRELAEVFRIVNESTREIIENPCSKVLRTGAVIGLANHTALIAKDGSEHPIEDSAAPIIDAQGQIVGVVLVFHDVTERRRAEAIQAEQREWLETTLVSIGDAVIATDIHGRVAFMNPVAEHMTGWRSAEAKGVNCTEVFNIVNETTRESVENPVSRVLREGVVVGLANHTVLIARDGVERPIDDSAAPIRNREGRVAGAVLVFHDVSERRRAERERQAAEREREHLLQSERVARSEAERANRLKDDFVATLSHELRTPLNAILGWTQILRRESLDASTLARGVNVIERNTRLQAQLISDLLDVSSIVSGKMRLELQVTDLGAVVEHAIETVKPSADAKEITIERHGDAAIDTIAGDPARLQQVVWNLLSNAVKFSPKGGIVRVAVGQDQSSASITVSDSGTGIRPDFLPYLFDRFRQADASTTRRFGGLGLGLTIVKQLVELHGGAVSAHSEGEGKGATFVVTLPLDTARTTHDVVERGSTGIETERERLQGLKVIVVEDDRDARELVERLLSEAGCRVVAVASAREALFALDEDRPDILVSDIGLPDEDGYSLIKRIRELDRGDAGALPAIALTAFARASDRMRALRAGFQAHIAKPVDPSELLAVVGSFAGIVES